LGGRVNRNKIFAALKVPRQCPLVLLVEVRLVCGICSILILKEFGAAEEGQNFEKLTFGGPHEKHAVQRGIWVPTQHLLWDQGKS
jgi:hypothetical protein